MLDNFQENKYRSCNLSSVGNNRYLTFYNCLVFRKKLDHQPT